MSEGHGWHAFNLFAPYMARMPSGWTGRGLSTSSRAQSAPEVAERLNALTRKTGIESGREFESRPSARFEGMYFVH